MKKSDFPRSKHIIKFKKLKNGLFKVKYKKSLSWHGSISYYNKKIKLHRDDGPALILDNGNKYYYKKGLCHRENGPAIICRNRNKYYYINDEELNIIFIIKKSNKLEFFKCIRP